MNGLTLDKETHKYKYGDKIVSSVTGELQAMGFYNFSGIPAGNLETARVFGKAVHYACYLHNEGKLNLPKLDVKILPYLTSWNTFVLKYGFMVERSEISLYSKKYGFAGTLDAYGYNCLLTVNKNIDGYAVVDIKTSASINPATDFQLAGYAILLAELLNIKPQKIKRFCVQLTEDQPNVKQMTDDSDIDAFLHIHYAYLAKKRKGII